MKRWDCYLIGAGFAAAVLMSRTAFGQIPPSDEVSLAPPPQQDAGEYDRADEHFDGRDRDPFGWYVPDFARLQSGGFEGHVNVGLGYAVLDDIVNWKLGYGYVAPGNDSDEPVHTLDTSISIRPFELGEHRARWVPLFFGAGLLYTPDSKYDLVLPKRYAHLSETYYRPTALRWTAHIGTEVAWRPGGDGFVERHALFYQAVMLDRLGQAYLDNPEAVKFTDAFASAFGYRMAW